MAMDSSSTRRINFWSFLFSFSEKPSLEHPTLQELIQFTAKPAKLLLTLTNKGGVPRGHAGVLVDGEEGAGGLHQTARVGARGQHQPWAAVVKRPGLETRPCQIPALRAERVTSWQPWNFTSLEENKMGKAVKKFKLEISVYFYLDG